MAIADELRGGLSTYIPADRNQAMSEGQTLSDRQRGTVLFADPDAPQRIREALAVVQADDSLLAERLREVSSNALA